MLKKLVGLVLVAALAVNVGLVVPVLAQEEPGDSETSPDVTTMMQVTNGRTVEAKQKAAEAREAAKQRIEERKAQVEAKTTEVRTKACEARQTNIANRLKNMAAFGERHKGTFDAILNRVEEFKVNNNLSVDGEAELMAAIDVAKMTVDEKVVMLDDLKGEVNCTDPDSVASTLEAFKSASTELRDALKSYRDAIRTYMQAVKQAAEAQLVQDSAEQEQTSEEGSQQ